MGGAAGAGPAVLLGAGIVYEIVASACSSPQTTELNADARAPTLMKWVHLGLGQAAVFVVLAAAWESKRKGGNAKPILVGGALAGAMMYGSYVHAKKSGQASTAPATETYAWGNPT